MYNFFTLLFIDGKLKAEMFVMIFSIKHKNMLVTAWRWDLQVPHTSSSAAHPVLSLQTSYAAITETHRPE